MTVPTAPIYTPNLPQTATQAQSTVGPDLSLISLSSSSSPSSPSPPSPSSPPLPRLSSIYTSLSTAVSTSTSRILKITLPTLTFGNIPPPTPLTPFSPTSPRYTDSPLTPRYSVAPVSYQHQQHDSALASPPYSPVSPYHDYLRPYAPCDDGVYGQSSYAAMGSRQLHVLSRYVAYYGRSYYVLALLSIITLTALYTTAATLLYLESSPNEPGSVGLRVDVIYCTLLALLSVPIAGCVSFLIRRSNKPHVVHWTTQTDFHMMSGLCLSGCSLALYTLTTLPSSPLSFICSTIIDYDTVDWICLISGLTQGFGVLTGGLFLLSTLTIYFNSIRFINSLPLEIIQDPDSPGFWRGVNVGDVDWEEERFVML